MGTSLSHWAGAGHITSAWESCKNTAVCFDLSHWGSEIFQDSRPCLATFYIHHLPTFWIKHPQVPLIVSFLVHHLTPAYWWLFNSTVRAVTQVRGQFHVSHCLSASWELHLPQANLFHRNNLSSSLVIELSWLSGLAQYQFFMLNN